MNQDIQMSINTEDPADVAKVITVLVDRINDLNARVEAVELVQRGLCTWLGGKTENSFVSRGDVDAVLSALLQMGPDTKSGNDIRAYFSQLQALLRGEVAKGIAEEDRLRSHLRVVRNDDEQQLRHEDTGGREGSDLKSDPSRR